MTDNNSMDHVRVNNRFNLRSLYESDLTNGDDNYESPFSYIDCDDCELEQFSEKSKHLHNYTSYFPLNCPILSTNRYSFHDLLCQLQNEHFPFDFIGFSHISNCDRDQRLALPG